VLQPASGEERANIVTCSAGPLGKQEQRCCSKHEKKENRYGHFCVKTHHKQSEHCLSPRVLGRRVRLEQSDPDAPGPGPFRDRGAERLGIDFAWSPELWGYDAVTPLAYLAAKTSRMHLGTGIMQIRARTPAMIAIKEPE
jgi:Luciferase-like monooxygenase